LPLGPEVPEKSTLPPALVMNRALPPLLLVVNSVCAPLLVVMVASVALLLLENATRLLPPLLMMAEAPAELAFRNVTAPLLVIAAFPAVPLSKEIKALLVKVGAEAELLMIPAPLMVKKLKLVNEYTGAAAVN